jgi:hypothetical protein
MEPIKLRRIIIIASTAWSLIMVLLVVGYVYSLSHKKATYVKVGQGSVIKKVSPGGTIKLRREWFTLYFPLNAYDAANQRFHAAQIVCSTRDLLAQVRFDMPADSTPFLAPGTGYAGDLIGYNYLMVCETGHHYIMYVPGNSAESRAVPVNDLGNGRAEVKWDIENIWYNLLTMEEQITLQQRRDENRLTDADRPFTRGPQPVRAYTGNELYLVLFDDVDLDGMVGRGEVVGFKIKFKD